MFPIEPPLMVSELAEAAVEAVPAFSTISPIPMVPLADAFAAIGESYLWRQMAEGWEDDIRAKGVLGIEATQQGKGEGQ